jgi:hypothetical protein
MDTKRPTDTAATVIIGQRIRAGSELDRRHERTGKASASSLP